MKTIKKVAVTPIEQIDGSIVDTFNVTDKTRNAPSVNAVENELVERNQIITVTSTNTITTTETKEKVKFNSIYGQEGNKLTLSNNAIVIGENISKVKISACICTTYDSPVGLVALNLYKNDSGKIVLANKKTSDSGSASVTLSPVVMSVAKGDEISVYVQGSSAGTIYQSYRCFLTVEKIA